MFAWLKRRKTMTAAAVAWRDAILSRSRTPALYHDGLLADTLDGRFEAVTLVATSALRRIRQVEPDGRLLADRVYRALFSSFDHALREEGVGDSSIARKMRKMGEEFFGLARAMDEAIQSEAAEDMLTDVLKRNIQSDEAKARALAHFVLETDRAMSALSDTQARSGQVTA